MSQSAIWDALLVAGDMLADERLDDCDRALDVVDTLGAWDFKLVSPSSLADLRFRRVIGRLARRVARAGGRVGDMAMIGNATFRVVADPLCPRDRAYVLNGDLVMNPERVR